MNKDICQAGHAKGLEVPSQEPAKSQTSLWARLISCGRSPLPLFLALPNPWGLSQPPWWKAVDSWASGCSSQGEARQEGVAGLPLALPHHCCRFLALSLLSFSSQPLLSVSGMSVSWPLFLFLFLKLTKARRWDKKKY